MGASWSCRGLKVIKQMALMAIFLPVHCFYVALGLKKRIFWKCSLKIIKTQKFAEIEMFLNNFRFNWTSFAIVWCTEWKICLKGNFDLPLLVPFPACISAIWHIFSGAWSPKTMALWRHWKHMVPSNCNCRKMISPLFAHDLLVIARPR